MSSPCAQSPEPAIEAPPRKKTRPSKKNLLADPKERAEHLMLLDLGRNDVGRVADHWHCRGY